ncbi:acetyl-CoA carboxylase carboxyltransferase subunit alpha [Bdellovibrionota bacterium FG-1]
MEAFFEFEKPIVALEKKLQDLRALAKQEGVDFSNEINILNKKLETLIDETYAHLSPWQRVQLSRHPARPYTRDYIDLLFPDFLELQGDRTFGDDQAILGGTATWKTDKGDITVMILGHQKGRTTKQKIERNFGMARPEGYRKAMRLMQMAERFKMPMITLMDTPGAYPGIEAEERGQSQAIAECLRLMAGLNVPIISVVIGEGGSGGALAIGVGNRVLMQEYSTYAVISPESCAAILWSDSSLAERATDRLKMNPTDLLKLGVIDAILPEPQGGAHRDWNLAASLLKEGIAQHLNPLIKQAKANAKKSPKKLIMDRTEKFRAMGQAALAHAPDTSG